MTTKLPHPALARRARCLLPALLMLLCAGAPALGATAPAAAPDTWQDPQTIRQTALSFLQAQTSGMPGTVRITLGEAVSNRMAACTAMEAFLPPGARLWGTTSVGVRCSGARPWTLYLQARIAVDATYFVAGRQISAGQTIQAGDLIARQGDLTLLPRSIVTDPSQAIGQVAQNMITAGLPVRQDLLHGAIVVQQGQNLRVVAKGNHFEVSAEGQVLTRASVGQMVQVRMRSGQVVSGVVAHDRSGGVEVIVSL